MTDKFLPKDSDQLKVVKGVEKPSSLNSSGLKIPGRKLNADTTADEFVDGIIDGNINFLGRAISLIESNRRDHFEKARQIVEKCLPLSGKSVRIGITGVPGVGKSTFIEALGTFLINHDGKKIAVLAVDPSSTISKGSILGDKTRMAMLSSHKNAFIRPSPSGGSLGGVARKTRETIILCEAAGFDTIIIETVGVGQSEITVHSMVDFFLLLMLAGAGDELQGIKRGIIELADMILINKSDDLPREKISLAMRTYQNALHLYPAAESGWTPVISSCSSVANEGIADAWAAISKYAEFTKQNNYFWKNRQNQAKYWLYETINSELSQRFFGNKNILARLRQLEKDVVQDKISPFDAAQELLLMC